MANVDSLDDAFEENLHKSAYIFDPSEEAEQNAHSARPAKRRKVPKKADRSGQHNVAEATPAFQPLFNGTESEWAARTRMQLFQYSWSMVDWKIQKILRDTNQTTLHQVTSFLLDAPEHVPAGKIPSAFIITGPNIASQDLLFEQLSEALHSKVDSKTVRLRSGDAPNLKAVLKKIIHDVIARDADDENDQDLTTSKDDRKFLNYDLEALHAHLKSAPRRHVVIAFQDSEAFESTLLSDLITLLSSWFDRIPFAFLFGVATSVELFEARLLKSTCQCLCGDQFDVEQSASIVGKIFKAAVAHADVPLRLGAGLVGTLLERQHEQVASIPQLVCSLKYSYMCHFYGNPLAVLLSGQSSPELFQDAHFEALRSLPSFRRVVEAAVADRDVNKARLLLDDDEYFYACLRENLTKSQSWSRQLLFAIKVLSINKPSSEFAGLYLDALSHGIDLTDHHAEFAESIKRQQPADCILFLTKVLDITQNGDSTLGLTSWAHHRDTLLADLQGLLAEVQQLCDVAEEKGHVLRSEYSGQSKVVRTTVVAQKVQLSRDSAALTEDDKSYTALIDRLVETLTKRLQTERIEDVPFHEIWLFDSRIPYKDVFIPRPRVAVERALSRPHDYLGCSCCSSQEDQIAPTQPTTSILYQLYLETGSLINVADLWSAYYAIVGEGDEDGTDERRALVLFYRAMAEMKVLGLVKQSRKKADHVAKLAWKGL
ncbi:origin recognition complex subunit 3 N-terminus-domain-containing protein [Xylariomycetidae sp. FL0641]|nr:origin recognition complex subunit 3 N-terminus-domain-containing protein [Xylariomycetidae sp. FL0641]